MNTTTKTAILTLAQADISVTAEQLKALENVCSNTPEQTSPADYMTSAEVCAALGNGKPMHPVTLCRWVKQGLLNPIRINRRVMKYRRAEVMALLSGNAPNNKNN